MPTSMCLEMQLGLALYMLIVPIMLLYQNSRFMRAKADDRELHTTDIPAAMHFLTECVIRRGTPDDVV